MTRWLANGTTLIECRLTGRNGIGIDINPAALRITEERLNFVGFDTSSLTVPSGIISLGDARRLAFVETSIDLVLLHPPYADIISYSDGNIAGDLSNIGSIDEFCDEIEVVARECFRVLKPGKYCAVLMGDTRRKKFYVSLAYRVMERFFKVGFLLREDIIKVQHNCRATGFWKKRSIEYNFLLIMHEHLFVFLKP